MSEHTPGPWHSEGERIYGPSGYLVSRADMDTREQRCTDARLIAAAPELLEALQNTVSMAKPYFSDDAQMLCLRLANEAIAKATGKQP